MYDVLLCLMDIALILIGYLLCLLTRKPEIRIIHDKDMIDCLNELVEEEKRYSESLSIKLNDIRKLANTPLTEYPFERAEECSES